MAIAPLGTPVGGNSGAAAATTLTNAVPTAAQGVTSATTIGYWTIYGVGTSIGAIPTPTGWAPVTGTAQVSGTTFRSATFFRYASAEPASYSVSGLTSGAYCGLMRFYSGVDGTTDQDVAATNAISTTAAPTPPAITPLASGAFIDAVNGIVTASGATTTTYSSANMTKDLDSTSARTAATNAAGGLAHFAWVSGAFSPNLAPTGTPSRGIALTMAIRPAAAAAAAFPASQVRRIMRPPMARRRAAQLVPQQTVIGAYDAMVNADTPWGAWDPNETSGTTIADDSGNSRPLTITGTPTTYAVAGPRSDMSAIAWPATTTDFAQTAATVASAPATGDYALEAWFFMSAFPAANVNVAQVQSSTTNYFGLRLLSTGAIRTQAQAGGGTLITSGVLSTGVWHHVVAKYSNGVFHQRVDKVSSATSPKVVALTGSTVFVHGGASNLGGAVTIGPTAFYDHALSDVASDAHYDGVSPSAAPAFVSTIARRAIRGLPPRRRTRVEAVPPQIVVTAPTPPPLDARRVVRRFVTSRRGRSVGVVPPQIVVAPPTHVPSTRRRVVRGFVVARHRSAVVTPPQDTPPPEARRRTARGFMGRRRSRVEVTPPQVVVAPPTYVPAVPPKHVLRGVPRRGRRAEVTPPQVVVAPPSYVATIPPKHALRGTPRRGRRAEVVPAQQAAPVAPPYIPATPPKRVLRGTPRRARRADVPPAQAHAHRGQPRRPLRGLVRRVGHAVGVFVGAAVTPLQPGSEDGVLTAAVYSGTLTAPVYGATLTASTVGNTLTAPVAGNTLTAATYSSTLKET